MKKLLAVAVVLVSGVAAGCGPGVWRAGWHEVGEVSAKTAVSRQPEVSFPLLEQFGWKVHPDTGVVRNGTSFSCAIFAYGTEVARLRPAQAGIASVRFVPFDPEVPLLARCYANPDFTGFVGTAWTRVRLRGANPTPFQWTVSTRELRRPNGQYASVYGEVPAYPAPDADTRPVEMRLPKEFNGIAALQFLNNTYYQQVVSVAGVPVGTLHNTGDILYYPLFRARIDGASESVPVGIALLDRGRLVGTFESWVTPPRQGVVSYQFVPGTQEFRSAQR